MTSSPGAKLKEFIEALPSALRGLKLSALETAFLLATAAFVAIVFYFYAAKVGPRQAELSGLEGRERAARARLAAAEERKKKIEEQQNNASLIVDSMGQFERRLKDRSRGTPQIIDELDNLARAHGVSAGDFSYKVAVAEPTPEPDAATRRSERDKQVFTALGISTTLTGDYRDLRRLISAIERSQTFMLINSVAFQGAADRGQRGAAGPVIGPGGVPVAPRAPQSGGPDEMAVALKLEIDTYFREN
ncbi:MAG: hypothetical protein KF868_19110 [Acidobacteria bacterium]|nr:hypothetical protein [Acidobacteriota bacterium]MCW5971380.1 hypothetical protein [Blastocatellales bacterium]